jgi:hypothetical protein
MSSTNSTPAPAPTTASKILTALSGVGGVVSLGVEIAEEVVPLVKGVVTSIKAIDSPQGTVSYQVVISTDATELDGVETMSEADLAAWNQYLVAHGAAPLTVPTIAADPLDAPAASTTT